MPRTISTTVYKFSELSPEAKKRAIEAHRYYNVSDDNYTYENTLELWKNALSAIGWKNADIRFSGFGNQGDGACIASVELNLAEFLKFAANPPDTDGSCGDESPEALAGWLAHKIGFPTNYTRQAGWLASIDIDNYFDVSIEQSGGNAGHYCHEHSYRFDWEYYDRRDDVIRQFELLFDDMQHYRIAICRAIYRDLEADYDYATSDSAIIETIEDSDYEFDINGNPA